MSKPALEKTDIPDAAHLCAMPALLLDWYDRHKRSMPWRDTPTPYRVLVSEIMLQQTQVDTVIPYFRRFVEELPGFSALAAVDDERLLKLWQGLGYYRRAHNLKKAARQVAEQYDGVLPADYDAIRALPGVGDYTAGAVASIAFGIAVPAVDGNVLRVMARLTGWEADIAAASTKTSCAGLLRGLIPLGRAGDFTQALMELGALVCRPGEQAKCSICPLTGLCTAHREERVARLPVKTPARARREENRTILMLSQEERLLIRKRSGRGLLSGLYEPANLEGWLSSDDIAGWVEARSGRVEAITPLGEADHHFSHITWHMRGWLVHTKNMAPSDGFFATPDDLRKTYALPAAFRHFIEQVL